MRKLSSGNLRCSGGSIQGDHNAAFFAEGQADLGRWLATVGAIIKAQR
jgi:hypothetical protein